MKDNRCKDCPVKIAVYGPGIIEVKSVELIQCCRAKRQLKALKAMNTRRGKDGD